MDVCRSDGCADLCNVVCVVSGISMIKRNIEQKLFKFLKQYPVIMLTGPRQSGKTTLCKIALPDKPYVSLENPDSRGYALSDPKGFLSEYPNGVIIDEAQHAPEFFSYIQGHCS